MAAKENRSRGGILQHEFTGTVAELCDERVSFRRVERRAAKAVGHHHGAEVVDRRGVEFTGETADGGVAEFAAAAVVDHVKDDERAHLVDQGAGRADAFKESFRERPARRFVAGTDPAEASVFFGLVSGGGFAEVMGEHGEKEGAAVFGVGLAPGGEVDERVATVGGVGKRITFRMPFGVLRRAAQGGELREMHEPAGLFQHGESMRRLGGLRRPLVPLAPDALNRKFRAGADDAAAKRGGLGGEREVEARGELKCAQHPQRVFDEGRTGVPEDAGRQIALSAVRIEQLAGERIAGDGVDREIAAGGGIGIAQVRVGSDGETAMSEAGLRFAARQAEIVVGLSQSEFNHTKTLAHDIGRPKGFQDGMERFKRNPLHLDVEVLGRESEQGVADATAGKPRTGDSAQGRQNGEQISRYVHACLFGPD